MKTFNTSKGKVAIITDTHFGARADSPVFHDYFMRFFDDEFFPFLEREGIKVVLHLGDFTDRRKYINFVTLNKVRNYFIRRIKEMEITLICTVGNHDTYYKNTNEINSMHELFSNIDHIHILTEVEEVMFDKTKVLLVPWINESNYESSIAKIQSSDAEILMGHLEIKKFLMNRGQTSETGFDATMFDKFKLVASGHFHHKSDAKNIFYLGAPYELTFADINDPRGYHSWEINSTELDFHQNPYKMFYKVFYNDKDATLPSLLKKISNKFQGSYVKVVVQNRMNPVFFDKFMEKLFSLGPADIKIEDDDRLVGNEEMIIDTAAEDTLTILNKYVDGLEIDSNKDKIKEELRTLYIEAQNAEK
jgi:DNA repair exonuclease SbcCD nuclease subunit